MDGLDVPGDDGPAVAGEAALLAHVARVGRGERGRVAGAGAPRGLLGGGRGEAALVLDHHVGDLGENHLARVKDARQALKSNNTIRSIFTCAHMVRKAILPRYEATTLLWFVAKPCSSIRSLKSQNSPLCFINRYRNNMGWSWWSALKFC